MLTAKIERPRKNGMQVPGVTQVTFTKSVQSSYAITRQALIGVIPVSKISFVDVHYSLASTSSMSISAGAHKQSRKQNALRRWNGTVIGFAPESARAVSLVTVVVCWWTVPEKSRLIHRFGRNPASPDSEQMRDARSQ